VKRWGKDKEERRKRDKLICGTPIATRPKPIITRNNKQREKRIKREREKGKGRQQREVRKSYNRKSYNP
jgi:hypothetical protein